MTICRSYCLTILIASFGVSRCILGQEKPEPPLISFEDEGGKWGFLSATGNVVIGPKYDAAGDFDGGFAKVWSGKKLLLINAAGKEQFQFPTGTQWTRGIADGRIWFEEPKSRKWGLCDIQGKVLLEPKFDNVREFAEGLAAVNIGAERHVPVGISGGKWGYVNTMGELVVPLRYQLARPFSEGLANVWEQEKTLFIDKSGKTVLDIRKVENEFASVGEFREGLAPMRIDKGVKGKMWPTRFINREGKTVFEVEGHAEEFHDGLAVIRTSPGKEEDDYQRTHGFIDKLGKLVIPAGFAEAFPFSEGLAAVRTKKTTIWGKGDTWGFIDKTGKYRIEPQFNQVRSFAGGVAEVHIGGELIEVFDAPYYWVGGEWWLIDSTGKKLKRTSVDRKD